MFRTYSRVHVVVADGVVLTRVPLHNRRVVTERTHTRSQGVKWRLTALISRALTVAWQAIKCRQRDNSRGWRCLTYIAVHAAECTNNSVEGIGIIAKFGLDQKKSGRDATTPQDFFPTELPDLANP